MGKRFIAPIVQGVFMSVSITQFAARQILTNYNESLFIEAKFSESVSITGVDESTYLHLSNGGWAIYDETETAKLRASGSADDTFVFRYDVAPTDDSTPDLSVNGFYLGNAILNEGITSVPIDDRDVYLINATPDDRELDDKIELVDKVSIVGNTVTNNDLILP